MGLRVKRLPGGGITPPRPDHGRYIYSYYNIRTNQVVYSLSQTLNSHAALKQLPDAGANNTPTHIRKDLWRPLYTLSLPSAHPHALRQGLHAFKKLREYRKLHELTWKPPLALSQPYSDADLEYMKQELEDRGGNKKESVYDVIKRRKARLRELVVMDQKANSVADLAQVLLDQEEVGRKTRVKREEELRVEREAEVKEMMQLAGLAGKGELAELDRQIDALQLRIDSVVADPEGTSKRKLSKELYRLKSRKTRMQFAADAVAKAGGQPQQAAVSEKSEPRREKQSTKSAEPAERTSKPRKSLGSKQVHSLRAAQSEVRADLGKKIDAKLAASESRLAESIGKLEESAMRAEVSRLKLKQRQLQLAAEVSGVTKNSAEEYTNARDVQIKSVEYRVQLASEDLEEATRSGKGEREEELRRALAHAEKKLGDLKSAPVEEPPAAISEAEAVVDTAEPMQAEAQIPVETTLAAPPTEQAETDTATTTASADIDWNALLPSFPPRDSSSLPKRSPLVRKLKRLNSPIFSTEGIKVTWQDPLDAEYAAVWPEKVAHGRMGWTRYTAPTAEAPAVDDIAEWRAMQWGGKASGPVAEIEGDVEGAEVDAGEKAETAAQRKVDRRKVLVEGIKSDILRQVREREEQRQRGTAAGPTGTPALDVGQPSVEV